MWLGPVNREYIPVEMWLKSFPFIEDLQIKRHLMGEKKPTVLHLILKHGNLYTRRQEIKFVLIWLAMVYLLSNRALIKSILFLPRCATLVYACALHECSANRSQKGAQICRNWSYRQPCTTMLVRGTKRGSSARAEKSSESLSILSSSKVKITLKYKEKQHSFK